MWDEYTRVCGAGELVDDSVKIVLRRALWVAEERALYAKQIG